MGLQFIPPDTIGRLATDFSARVGRRSDTSESTFGTFLDEARFGRAPRNESNDLDELDQLDELNDLDELDDLDESDESLGQRDERRTESDDLDEEGESGRVDHGEESLSVDPQGQSPVSSDVAAAALESATSEAEARSAGKAEATATSTSQSAHNSGAISSSVTVPETGEPGVRQPATATVSGDTAQAMSPGSTQSASEAVGRVMPESPVENLSAAQTKSGSTQTQVSAEEAALPSQERSPEVRGQANTEQTSADSHNRNLRQSPQSNAQAGESVEAVTQAEETKRGKGDPAPVVQQETIHQRKVRLSLERSLQGGTREQNPSSQQQPPVQVQVQTGHAAQARLQTFSTPGGEKESLITSLSIRGASGDETAAAISRFMLSGADGSGQSDNATASAAQSASVSRPGISQLGTAAVSGAPATSVGEALVSGVDGAEDLSAAARMLRASQGAGRFNVTMQLDPPEMGQLKVQVRMHQQVMTLQVEAQTQAVAKLIESRMNELRETMASHGIRMDRVEVVVKAPTSGEANTSGQDSNSANGANQEQSDIGQPGDWDGGSLHDDPSGESSDARSDTESTARLEDAEGMQASLMEDGIELDETATTELSLDLVA